VRILSYSRFCIRCSVFGWLSGSGGGAGLVWGLGGTSLFQS
jgi:hypothetical protein